MNCHDFYTYVNNSDKINNKREHNKVILVIMNSDDSMSEYCGYKADGWHTIGPYTNKCHYE